MSSHSFYIPFRPEKSKRWDQMHALVFFYLKIDDGKSAIEIAAGVTKCSFLKSTMTTHCLEIEVQNPKYWGLPWGSND